MHAPIALVNVADLSSTSSVDGIPSEESKALLLEARCSNSQSVRVSNSEVLEACSQSLVHLEVTRLVKLTLWCNTSNCRTGPRSFWEPRLVSVSPVAIFWEDLFREVGVFCGSVRILESEQPEISDLDVSKERRRSSTRSQVDEVGVVIVDNGRERCQHK